ncbi:DUF3558 family protein [Rhabdothermincola sediminis]|uniref:DUF3558 family protein n=1 Tax=Rhabdothermincola sediminis TaxID=2751370 RepID=UPI001AA020D9|nr:DUF3558 family protein [Rhabdothermincola sediminis]
MKTRTLALLIAGSLGLAACSGSSNSSSSTSTTSSSNTAESAASTSGGSSGGSESSASSRDLCAEVTAAEVASLLGEQIVEAKPVSSGSRAETGFNGPSCAYTTANGLGGAQAETISAEKYTAMTRDSITPVEALAGLGDSAFVAKDVTGQSVIRVFTAKGDDHWFIEIFRGTTPDKATQLAEMILG